MTMLIELRDVCKRYHEGDGVRVIFDHLDMQIGQGEIVAVLGKSGSGKSTLLNLLSGIDIPDDGKLLVRDTDITCLTEQQRTMFRRRNVGFIFQFFNLIPTLTVEENILLPLELNDGANEAHLRMTHDLLDQIGLQDRRNSFPDRLSGGEQQRVAIIRALIHRPLLLLADEPTGNLDNETGRQVMALLHDMVRKHHMTLILVTHSMECASIADRVLEARDGRLCERPVVKVPA